MGESDEGCAVLSRWLKLLGDVSNLLPDLMDMCSIQGEAADLNGAGGERDDAHDGAQQGGLARSALAGDTYKLASVYGEIEAAE